MQQCVSSLNLSSLPICVHQKKYLLKTDLPSVRIVIDAIAGDILRQGLDWFDGECHGELPVEFPNHMIGYHGILMVILMDN